MFSAISDPVLQVALWAGVGALSLTAAMAVMIVLLRLSLLREQAQWQAFVQRWRPLLLALMVDEAAGPALPPLPARDRLRFLRLWVYLHESVRGEAADRLNRAARELGLPAFAQRQLRRGSRPARLQAVLALGHLREVAAAEDLWQLARSRDPLVSLIAARALVQIDPLQGAERLTPLVLMRHDWDMARLATFLAEARDAFWLYMVRHLPALPVEALPRALRLAEALRLTLPPTTLRLLLSDAQDAEVVRAALPLVQDAALHDDLSHALTHADPGVRERALQGMARLAMPRDTARVAALLDDDDPQVRLASARVLVQLPFLDGPGLMALRAPEQRGAAELRHALAERDWERAAA